LKKENEYGKPEGKLNNRKVKKKGIEHKGEGGRVGGGEAEQIMRRMTRGWVNGKKKRGEGRA